MVNYFVGQTERLSTTKDTKDHEGFWAPALSDPARDASARLKDGSGQHDARTDGYG